METFSALLAICAGPRWIPHTKASDVRRYRPHYDVIVMYNSLWREANGRQWITKGK